MAERDEKGRFLKGCKVHHSEETKEKMRLTGFKKGHKINIGRKASVSSIQKSVNTRKLNGTYEKIGDMVKKRMSNKTYDEIYGPEKAEEIRKKIGLKSLGRVPSNKGKTYKNFFTNFFGKEKFQDFKYKKEKKEKIKYIPTEITRKKISDKLKKGYSNGSIKNWNIGLTKETNESIKKQSEWLKENHPMKGKVPWNFNIPMSDESKQKWMDNMDGKWGRYVNVSKIKRMTSILRNRKITPGERVVYEFTKQKEIPLIYTGNGLYWITGKKGNHGNDEIFCPDFINVEKNKIVEVYSRWHSTVNSNMNRDKRREEVYEENGISLLIIYDDNLKKNPSLELNKVMEFIK